MNYSFVVATGFCFISATMQAMEITKQDFGFKNRMNKNLPYFICKNDSHRTFANHELLWAERNAYLPQDVKNKILYIRFQQIMNNDSIPYFGSGHSYEEMVSFQNYKEKQDIFWANKGQQKAIYYFMHLAPISKQKAIYYFLDIASTSKKSLIIQEANKEFVEDMVQQIENVPESIKYKLLQDFSNTSSIQTDKILKENKIMQEKYKTQSFFAKVLIGGIFIAVFLYIYMKTNNIDFKYGLQLGAGIILLIKALGADGVLVKTGMRCIIGDALLTTDVLGEDGIIIGTVMILGITSVENILPFLAGIVTTGVLTVGDMITEKITKNFIQESLIKQYTNENTFMG